MPHNQAKDVLPGASSRATDQGSSQPLPSGAETAQEAARRAVRTYPGLSLTSTGSAARPATNWSRGRWATGHEPVAGPLAVPLRCCAGCSRSHLGDDRDGPYFCPRCSADRKWTPPAVGGTVRTHVPYGPFQDRGPFVVRAVDGDMATLRKLGFPDSPSFEVHVRNTLPVSR